MSSIDGGDSVVMYVNENGIPIIAFVVDFNEERSAGAIFPLGDALILNGPDGTSVCISDGKIEVC